MMGLGVVAVLAAGYIGYQSYMYVTTDNATVQAHTLMLSSKVAGIVQDVLVEENQKVKKGDVLARIDSRDYANLQHQVDSEVGSVRARLHDAEVNFKRVQQLFKENAVTQQQFDTAEATYRDLSKKEASAQAQADQASLNLSYTELRAPNDGVIAKKAVEPGMVVPIGQPLFGFVESTERWVIANLKETELSNVIIGEPAFVEVDAIPGRVFDGQVESLSPSTGAAFALLPPDNATGNFTKVVQRVPVRIKLLNLSEKDIDRLQTGLSAEIKVKVH
jgi:membrane fusion protein (multidrug efflux system)